MALFHSFYGWVVFHFKDRETWHAAVMESQTVWHDLATQQQQYSNICNISIGIQHVTFFIHSYIDDT